MIHACPTRLYMHLSLGRMLMSWTMCVGGILPFRPARITISFAERHIAILARSRYFRLTMKNTSESTRRTDWIMLSPGKYGQA
eukprot:3365810-Pyramimonas_sp.AAC.1